MLAPGERCENKIRLELDLCFRHVNAHECVRRSGFRNCVSGLVYALDERTTLLWLLVPVSVKFGHQYWNKVSIKYFTYLWH